MRLQNFVLPNEICDTEELYFRHHGQVKIDGGEIILSPGSSLTTDTYFNLFDAYTWEKYTGLDHFEYCIRFQGQAVATLIFLNETGIEKEIWKKEFKGKTSEELPFYSDGERGYYYLNICAVTEFKIYELSIHSRKLIEKDVCIGINICTYKREQQLRSNLRKLVTSDFFDENSPLFGKVRICVVDNASELRDENMTFVKVVHNKNTGGSGGFTRGITELKKEEGISHMVFMDDDVEFLMETFYRLYAFLSYLTEELEDMVVAGRMFRMDERRIQYTAAEKWNSGEISHVGFQKDMTLKENLKRINDSCDAEYTGWWLGCFSMKFVRNNMPLPFFLHCDDVEYGLRHGGIPVILNGIQVWHETYEYRQNRVITYYDLRNRYIVNDLYDLWRDKAEPVEQWKEWITKAHLKEDYQKEYMLIQAFLDYTKGVKWLKKIDSGRYHKWLLKSKANRVKTALLWRVAEVKYQYKLYEK